MEESSTYQAIITRGEAQGALGEARKVLLRLGSKRFGPPAAETTVAIEAIADLNQLEELIERTQDVSSWEELLADQPRRRRNGRRKKTSE